MKRLILLSILFAASFLSGAEFRPALTLVRKGPAAVAGNKVTLSSRSDRETVFAEFRFDASEMAGSCMTGSIRGDFKGTLPKDAKRNGVFVQMAYPAIDRSHERLGGASQGFFEKGLLPLNISFDPHAKECLLRVGLKNCRGTVEFDLAGFRLETLFERDSSDYVCEYSDAVRRRTVHRGVMSPYGKAMTDETTYADLRKWNVNLMRLQLNVGAKGDAYFKAIDNYIENVIPKALAYGEKYGIKIIIDLHMVPNGGQMRGELSIFDSPEAVERFYAIWERIVRKFKGHPALYAYDLINEPSQNRKAKIDYWNLQRTAAEKIRKLDPETPICVESNVMDSPLTFCYMKPIRLRNIIYELHFYEPFDFTHYWYKKADLKSGKAKVKTFPGTYYGTYWSSDLREFRKKLAIVRAFELRHKAKMFVGEFSCQTYAPGAKDYLESCIRIFEEYKWDWTYHAFREAAMWSVEHAGTALDDLKAVPTTPSKEILLKAFEKNSK